MSTGSGGRSARFVLARVGPFLDRTGENRSISCAGSTTSAVEIAIGRRPAGW
jgi:hypothetical protein